MNWNNEDIVAFIRKNGPCHCFIFTRSDIEGICYDYSEESDEDMYYSFKDNEEFDRFCKFMDKRSDYVMGILWDEYEAGLQEWAEC